VLGRIGGTKVFMPLTVALRDKCWDTRRAAIEALGKQGDARAIDSLVPMLKDKDADVRLSTVRALETLKDERAIPALVLTLTDEQKTVRMAAAHALHKISPRWDETEMAHSVIPELETANRSREYWVKQAATEVLTRLAQARQALDVEHGTTHVVMSEASPLNLILSKLMEDPDRDFRLAAVESLGRLTNAHSREMLQAAQQDIDPWVRQAAEIALETFEREPTETNP
jgi:HEAT repeat protein